jgi:hypothetical protein
MEPHVNTQQIQTQQIKPLPKKQEIIPVDVKNTPDSGDLSFKKNLIKIFIIATVFAIVMLGVSVVVGNR